MSDYDIEKLARKLNVYLRHSSPDSVCHLTVTSIRKIVDIPDYSAIQRVINAMLQTGELVRYYEYFSDEADDEPVVLDADGQRAYNEGDDVINPLTGEVIHDCVNILPFYVPNHDNLSQVE